MGRFPFSKKFPPPPPPCRGYFRQLEATWGDLCLIQVLERPIPRSARPAGRFFFSPYTPLGGLFTGYRVGSIGWSTNGTRGSNGNFLEQTEDPWSGSEITVPFEEYSISILLRHHCEIGKLRTTGKMPLSPGLWKSIAIFKIKMVNSLPYFGSKRLKNHMPWRRTYPQSLHGWVIPPSRVGAYRVQTCQEMTAFPASEFVSFCPIPWEHWERPYLLNWGRNLCIQSKRAISLTVCWPL